MSEAKQNNWAIYTTTQQILTIIAYIFNSVAVISLFMALLDITISLDMISFKYIKFITLPSFGVASLLSGVRDYHFDPKGSKQSFSSAGLCFLATILNIIGYVIR